MTHRSVRILLTDDLCSALRSQARRSGDSMSAIVRRAVEAHLAELRPANRQQALRGSAGLWKGRPQRDVLSRRRAAVQP